MSLKLDCQGNDCCVVIDRGRVNPGQAKGTVVLATLRGDVHDIGKNLVGIILTNNGYRVDTLGIDQPIGAILDPAAARKADAAGMSGLLVKSTIVMRENLEEMSRQGLDLPLMLGGAALKGTSVGPSPRCIRPSTRSASAFLTIS